MQDSASEFTYESIRSDLRKTYERIKDTLLYSGSSYATSRSQLMTDIAAAEHYFNKVEFDKKRIEAVDIFAELTKISGVTNHQRLVDSLTFVTEQASRMRDADVSTQEKILRALVATRAELYRRGYPTLNVGHRLAAALAVTKPSLQNFSDILLPFDAFTVTLPEGLFMYADGSEAKTVEVCRYPSKTGVARIWVTTLTNVTHHGYLVGESTAELLRMLRTCKDKSLIPCETAVLNTVFNLVTMLCDKSAMKPVGGSHASWAKYGGHRAGQEPTRLVFQVTHDVQHDFRTELRQYASGNGHKLTVQFMVRGHWKHQVHGEGRALRRLQFIEPYWKGDAAAPIALSLIHI